MHRVLRVGLVGHGAIGSTVARALLAGSHGLHKERICLVAVLVQRPRDEPTLREHKVLFTTDSDEFFGADFDVCVEAAGQSAVRAHASRCLKLGRNCLVTSIGALTDDALLAQLTKAAMESGAQLQLASGAMPGLDWMSSSALEPGSAVTATQTKPPESWVGAKFQPGTTTPLPDAQDYAALKEPAVVFEGSAREAASYYPKNSNILAMLALSSAGLDDAKVKLIADPLDKTMRQKISYEGSAGSLTLEVVGKKSSNPRTSQVVPLSVIKALRNMSSPVAYGL